MKTFILIIALLFSLGGFAQTIAKSQISSGGDSNTNGNLSIVYSIGATNIAEKTNGNIHVSEGFISKNLDNSLGVKDITKLEGVKLYPNPTIDYINLEFSEYTNAQVRVFNLTGKEIINTTVNSEKTKLDLSNLSQGAYLMHVYDIDNAKTITYKVNKK